MTATPYDTLSPCAADVLYNIRQVTVAGRPVGIAGLVAAFAAVDAQGLTGDAEIAAELMRRVEQENYIPPALAGEYAAALLAEYHRAATKPGSFSHE